MLLYIYHDKWSEMNAHKHSNLNISNAEWIELDTVDHQNGVDFACFVCVNIYLSYEIVTRFSA